MTPKQKRAYNKATKALTDLGEVTFEDRDAYNQTLAMMSRALGSMIGTAAALHDAAPPDLHRAIGVAVGEVQNRAAASYGMVLAHQKHQSGKAH